jgi:hypothetical protein
MMYVGITYWANSITTFDHGYVFVQGFLMKACKMVWIGSIFHIMQTMSCVSNSTMSLAYQPIARSEIIINERRKWYSV